MARLFLAFANSETARLATLTKEDSEVNNVLNYRVAKGDYAVYREQFATRENIVSKLQLFQPDILLFLYSGHAGRDAIELTDGVAQAEGIAALLSRCPNLKLVVLNGCSTSGQVDGLLAKGIPVVVATSAPVDDLKATQFSIQFFTELSQNRKSIREAFNSAVEVAKVYGTVEHVEIISRAIGVPGRASNEPVWGLFCQPAVADLLDNWRLPEAPTDVRSNFYLVNALKFIYKQQSEVLRGLGEDAEVQNAILKRLPYTISEPLRKLLTPNDGSGAKFFDRPSQERYEMLLYVYRATLNFIGFTLMAQVWQASSEKTFALDDPGVEWAKAVGSLIVARSGDDANRSALGLVRLLAGALKKQKPVILVVKTGALKKQKPLLLLMKMIKPKPPLFFEELENALLKLEEPRPRAAIDYLEKQVASPFKTAIPDVQRVCPETEYHVAVVLPVFGFLIRYALTSVKDIKVLFYPGEPAADFNHQVVKLQAPSTALEDSTRSAKTYFKTATILLEDTKNKSRYLYLSPFLIDENAYTRTPKANLRYFVSYDPERKYFQFKLVSKPEDVLRIEEKPEDDFDPNKSEDVGQNDYYSLIKGQFAAFCSTALGKTLESL